jgi:AcrR family transcriptional regulator
MATIAHTPEGSSRRERKRLRMRTELLESARALIAEHGVAGLRVNDITERSDVALGSFYSHFETKDDIVVAVIAETITSLADAIGDLGEHLADPAEAMSVGVRKMIDLCHTDPELARLLVKLDDAEHRFEAMIWPRSYTVMRRGMDTGRFSITDPDLMLTLTIASVFATIRAIVEQRFSDKAASDCAAALLRLVGVDTAEAVEITARVLPPLPS